MTRTWYIINPINSSTGAGLMQDTEVEARSSNPHRAEFGGHKNCNFEPQEVLQTSVTEVDVVGCAISELVTREWQRKCR